MKWEDRERFEEEGVGRRAGSDFKKEGGRTEGKKLGGVTLLII